MEASISWLKTDFEAPKLSVKNAPEAVYSNNETTITVYVEEHSSLDTVLLNYTSNDCSTSITLEMTASQNQMHACMHVAEFRGRVYGIIPAALEQANIAAINMLEKEKRVYKGTIPSNTLKIVGVDLTSIELVNPGGPQYEEVKKIDKGKGIYKKIVLEKGKIVGATILGDRKGVTWIKKLMDQKTDVTKYKDLLLEEDFDYRRIF